MKPCKRCKKPVEIFPINKYGKPSTMCDYCYTDTMQRNKKKFEESKAASQIARDGEKWCMGCHQSLSLSEFKPNGKRKSQDPSASSSLCAACRERNKDNATRRRSKWSDDERKKHNDEKAQFARDCRGKMLAAYGSKCTCCGEATPEFLAVDHVNDDGYEHRRSVVGYDPTALYRWAKKRGFPDSLQLLCHNCNVAKAYYGLCPHKRPPLVA